MSRLREEAGMALITSVLLMSVMMVFAMATLSMIDAQGEQSGASRAREAAFNLAEAAMNAQIFRLSQDWPGAGSATAPYPHCTQQTLTHPRCPVSSSLTMLAGSVDTAGPTTWSTTVRDNSEGPTQAHYDDALAQTSPGYDANGDDRVWVRAQATAVGRTRTIVALVRAQETTEDLPRGALISGRLDISNKGRKTIIDAQGGSSESGLVAVRCTPVLGEQEPCLGHALQGEDQDSALADNTALLNHQIHPNIPRTAYDSAPAMTAEARMRLKSTAIAKGTYYASGCPPETGLSGQIVYIENGSCAYKSNTRFNSPGEPGMVLVARGSLWLGGTATFHGIIYHANEAGASDQAVQIHGNATVHGGILVDGDATTVAGSSSLNVRLDPAAFAAVRSYASAGIVQNTWREIDAAY